MTLYFESHITIDPVTESERLRELQKFISLYEFRLAKLYMQKGVPSNLDSFITARSNDWSDIYNRTTKLTALLQANKFVTRRYKIEAVLIDVKLNLPNQSHV